MNRQADAADYGLVGTVGGVAAMLLLAMLTIGASALTGAVPRVLVILLIVATALTAGSGVVLFVSSKRRRGD